MRKNPRRILSPQRLPFRHPGKGRTRKVACMESALNAWAQGVAGLSGCNHGFLLPLEKRRRVNGL
jgi:hypothetical protein